MLTYHRQPHRRPDGQIHGWSMTVTAPHGRPGLVVEAGRRRFDGGYWVGLCVRAGARALLWAQVDDWWSRVDVLQAASCASPGVIPPIAARTRTADWTRFMLDALAASAYSPLYAGEWWCGGASDWDGIVRFEPEALLANSRYWDLDWFTGRLMGLRPLSAPDDRRVGFWRKQLAAGHHPPVVLLYLSVLEMFLILDGHDRLQAALHAGIKPNYLIVAPIHHRRWPPSDQTFEARASVAAAYAQAWSKAGPAGRAGLNRSLIRVFSPLEDHISRMRVWPLRGGWPQWRAEVQTAAMGLDPEALDALLPPSG